MKFSSQFVREELTLRVIAVIIFRMYQRIFALVTLLMGIRVMIFCRLPSGREPMYFYARFGSGSFAPNDQGESLHVGWNSSHCRSQRAFARHWTFVGRRPLQ